MIIMICITIIAIALAGYFARRAKLMEKRKIRASLKSAETEIALRRSLKNLGTAYEKIKAHSVARCGKCGRLYTCGSRWLISAIITCAKIARQNAVAALLSQTAKTR